MNLLDVNSTSIANLRTSLDSGEISSVELTTAYLKRIEAKQEINAFIEVSKESALNQAKEADQQIKNGKRSLLLGIPIAIKDAIITKGIRTTCGSQILKDFIPPYDATVITKLKDNGAVIVGKTNMDEFAMGSSNENSSFGPVKNPWDLDRVTGGSSGGSAAAVSAGLAPVSLGTDTGGSIRQPASLCSVVGLKPTYGRVSRYGLVAYASSLDQIGTFSRNVADCAAVSQVIFGADSLDSTSVDEPLPDLVNAMKQSIRGVRVGIPKEYFISGIDGETSDAVKKALSELEVLGAKLVEISLPHTELALPCYYVIAPAEASSNLARFDGIRYGHRAKDSENLLDLYCRSRSEGFGAEVKRRIMIGTYVLSSGYYDAYYVRAQKVRSLIAKDFSNVFSNECDVIACPVSPFTAFRLGEKVSDPLSMYLTDIFTIPVNLAGLPGMSIPCGFDGKNLPIGLQLIGKAWDEATLFKVASAYQGSTDWHTRTPKV